MPASRFAAPDGGLLRSRPGFCPKRSSRTELGDCPVVACQASRQGCRVDNTAAPRQLEQVQLDSLPNSVLELRFDKPGRRAARARLSGQPNLLAGIPNVPPGSGVHRGTQHTRLSQALRRSASSDESSVHQSDAGQSKGEYTWIKGKHSLKAGYELDGWPGYLRLPPNLDPIPTRDSQFSGLDSASGGI